MLHVSVNHFIAALLFAAIFISFFIQTALLPVAGAWTVFFWFAVFLLLFTGRHEVPKDAFSFMVLIWAMYLSLHTFLIKPTNLGSINFTYFLVPCAYYLAMQRDYPVRLHIIACAVALIILALSTVYQFFFFHDWMIYPRRVNWPMLNPNMLGTLMAVGLVGAWAWFLKHRGWSVLWVALFGLALLATQSRGAFVAASVGITAYMAFGKISFKNVSVLISLFAAFLAFKWRDAGDLINLASQSFETRFPIWQATINMIKSHPWLGGGSVSFVWEYPNYRIEPGPDDGGSAGYYAHNDFLQIGTENGLIALGIYLLLFAVFFAKTRKANLLPACLVLTILVHAQVCFPLYRVTTALILGILFVWWRKECSEKSGN